MCPIYVCPRTKESLSECEDGLISADGTLYRFRGTRRLPDFLQDSITRQGFESAASYSGPDSAARYRNFLDWLFQTFDEDEATFRRRLVQKLNLGHGQRVLVTGCGLGDDIPPILEMVGSDGEVCAQDSSSEMIAAALMRMDKTGSGRQVQLSISDATQLPFLDNFFDGAFHFGGINLFGDIKSAIAEMNRVVKPGGRVVFGDESVAPWLRESEYGQISITNNALWGADSPIDMLPETAADVTQSWVLGNCFYVIDYRVSNDLPYMNMNVPHKGGRGGSMRTRHFGQLEGVTEESKRYVLEDAKRKGVSVHDWLEHAIKAQQT
jgi:SAM-dependent methyltransferase